MKRFCRAVLLVGALCGLAATAQVKDTAIPVTLIELFVNPEKFEGKKVAVTGYLQILRNPREVNANLFFHEEDAKHLLGNSIIVNPSAQMLKDEEKINNAYVRLTGKLWITPAANGKPLVGIRDIESYLPWPPPSWLRQ